MSTPFTPRVINILMMDFMRLHERVNIWSGMGTGKTVSTLTFLDELYMYSVITRPTLILAPLRVARNVWPDEVAKWSHLQRFKNISPIIGDVDMRRRALLRESLIYTINYDNLPWLMEELKGEWPFDVVVADESTRLKGYRTKQGAVRLRALSKVAHMTKRWINLTGSPAPNGLKDTWGSNWFIDRGKRLLGSYAAFSERWFYKTFDGRSLLPHSFSQEQISKAIEDITISIDIRDYYDIAYPVVSNVYVDLPFSARKRYKEMEREFFTKLGEDVTVTALSCAAKSMKLLQFCSGAVYIDEGHGTWNEVHDEKIEALKSIIEEANGTPILVAYHFKSDLARLLKKIPGSRELDKKPSTLKAWNEGKIPVLIAHPMSCGHGLNMQDGGNILVYFSHDWSLEPREQILERIGPTRQFQSGHDRPVFVYNIIGRDTLDELVIERTETKASVQEILKKEMKKVMI